MPNLANKVFDEALLLPADARIDLIERLLASLNLPVKEDIERLWAEEAERRIGQIDQGEVELIPGDEVFDRIRAKYSR